MKYVCDVCGWEYDEEEGYPEGGIVPVIANLDGMLIFSVNWEDADRRNVNTKTLAN